MRNLLCLFFIYSQCISAHCQSKPIFNKSRKKDKFSIEFLKVVNDAPNNFSHYKGKPINGTDEQHPGSNLFKSKKSLPGAVEARYIKDSSTTMEFYFGDTPDFETAEATFKDLREKITTAFDKLVRVNDGKVDTTKKNVLTTKFALMKGLGFYNYSISLEIIHNEDPGFYRVFLKFLGGKNQIFYHRNPTTPIGSFLMVNTILKSLSSLQRSYGKGCPVDIPTFTCKGKFKINDTIKTTYYKTGFHSLLNASSEFDYAVSAVETALGSDYIYYESTGDEHTVAQVAFFKSKDLDKPKKQTILVSIVECNDEYDYCTNQDGAYDLELSFLN